MKPISTNQTMTQVILAHLIRVGTISGLEAQGMYKCRSLSRRICDIKALHHIVLSEEKRDQTGQRYVRYNYVGLQPPVESPYPLPQFVTGKAS